MFVCHTVSEIRESVAAHRHAGRRISFVPTMGALHEGHASLIREAGRRGGCTIVSIFVNPTQFAPGEDFAAYPRNLDADLALCRAAGVSAVFAPSVEEMYGTDPVVFVDEGRMSNALCGRFRPGHFRGVLTVVAKLFNIVQPDVAVFGQKDAQQAVLIQRMVRDLNFPVEVVVAPTVREPDGLAMSSRNRYLTAEERSRAAALARGLRHAEQRVASGETDVARLVWEVRQLIDASEAGRVEYVEAVDAGTLEPVSQVKSPVLLALSVRVGRARLIDNTILTPPGPSA